MRADVYLTAAGYTQSRKKAQDLIDAGAVKIDGTVIKKSSVAINEAVEITKEFSPQESPAFVNGILGKLSRGMENE